jgi:hypothetical protein
VGGDDTPAGVHRRRLLRFGSRHRSAYHPSLSMHYHAVRRAAWGARRSYYPRTPYLNRRPDPCRDNLQDPLCLAKFWSARARAEAVQVKPGRTAPGAALPRPLPPAAAAAAALARRPHGAPPATAAEALWPRAAAVSSGGIPLAKADAIAVRVHAAASVSGRPSPLSAQPAKAPKAALPGAGGKPAAAAEGAAAAALRPAL